MTSYFQYDFFHQILSEGAELVGKYQLPQLSSTKILPTSEHNVVPFNLLMTSDATQVLSHCFIDDGQFERLYRNYNRYIPLLSATDIVISSDFSMYRDYSQERLIWNCRRNRSLAYAMQQTLGEKLIPTAGFAGPDTWDWCFAGLPMNSTLAITTNGVRSDPEAKRIFVGGVNSLVYQKHPYALVVCGKVDDWIYKKYPGLKVIHIPSFSEQWNERRCA